jgi:hypothetical protein
MRKVYHHSAALVVCMSLAVALLGVLRAAQCGDPLALLHEILAAVTLIFVGWVDHDHRCAK